MASTPTIGNMPGADLTVTFPGKGNGNVNTIVLLAEVLMAEQMAKFGFCQAQNMRTIKELDEKYELAWFASEVYPNGIHTWKQCAAAIRHFHGICTEHIRSHRG